MAVTVSITHPKLDPAAYEALMVDSGWSAPIELINGEAVVVVPSGGWANSAQFQLNLLLGNWLNETDNGGLALPNTFIAIGEHTLAPDFAYWRPERRPEIPRGRIDGAVPDLVVEVLSPETEGNDLGPKRVIYRHHGVVEYWLVDPDAETVTTETFGQRAQTLRHDATLSSPLLPGFAAPVASLFADR